MNKPFRLIFHIGAGKTGSTAIQQSLKKAREDLQKEGSDYWGLMLEYAPVKLYEWQKTDIDSAMKQFLALPPEEASQQLQKVLEQAIVTSQKKGIHTAIWSHEFFFDYPDR